MATGASPAWPCFHLNSLVTCGPPHKYSHPDLSMGGATFCLEPLTQLTTDQASPVMADSQVVEKFSFWSVCVLSQASGQKSQEGFFFFYKIEIYTLTSS